jgi:hypothetical protein
MGRNLSEFWAKAFSITMAVLVIILTGIGGWLVQDHLSLKDSVKSSCVTRSEHSEDLTDIKRSLRDINSKLDRAIEREIGYSRGH